MNEWERVGSDGKSKVLTSGNVGVEEVNGNDSLFLVVVELLFRETPGTTVLCRIGEIEIKLIL